MIYKKNAILIVGGLLCLTFSSFGQARDVVQTGLKIGDNVPELKIPNVYLNGGEKATLLNLSDYSDKLLIIDFWATWCAPCIQMMPVVEDLQAKFNDQVSFLEVTHESSKLVLPFLARLNQARTIKSNIPVVTDDVRLGELFRHVYLPHYVWIFKGRVVAITGSKEVSENGIKSILEKPNGASIRNGAAASLPVKRDLRAKYDKNKNLFFSDNGGKEQSIAAYSLVGRYTDGIGGGWAPRRDKNERIFGLTGRNCSFFWLYRIAYRDVGNFGISTISYKEADSLGFYLKETDLVKLDSLKRNGYSWCYESALDTNSKEFKGYEIKEVLDRMKVDLARFFPHYVTHIVKRKVMAYVIERVNNTKAFEDKETKGKLEVSNSGFYISGMSIDYLVFRLNNQIYDFGPNPIVDRTGFKGNVKLDYKGNPRSIKDLTSFFASKGLKLVKKAVTMDVLEVSRSVPQKGGYVDGK